MIRFVMLISPIEERIKNAQKIKERIPSLELIHADNSVTDIFDVHLDVLKTDPEKYQGVVMMEDDILLSRNFETLFDEVMKSHSNDIVQFFERALAKKPLKGGWQTGSGFCSTVCYYMPAVFTHVVTMQKYRKSFREDYFPKRHEPWGYPIDIYIAYVLGLNKMVYWRQLPYIVQHLDLQSTFKGRSTKRQSKYFIDDLKV